MNPGNSQGIAENSYSGEMKVGDKTLAEHVALGGPDVWLLGYEGLGFGLWVGV